MNKEELLEILKKGDSTKRFSSLIGVTLRSRIIPEETLSDILDVNMMEVRRWSKGRNLPLDFARPILVGKIIDHLEGTG
jgi:hypothetical protein